MSHLWRRAFSVVCAMTAFTSCEFLAPPQVRAGEPTDQVKASVDQVLQTLQDPSLKSEAMTAQRNAAIRQAAEKSCVSEVHHRRCVDHDHVKFAAQAVEQFFDAGGVQQL